MIMKKREHDAVADNCGPGDEVVNRLKDATSKSQGDNYSFESYLSLRLFSLEKVGFFLFCFVFKFATSI